MSSPVAYPPGHASRRPAHRRAVALGPVSSAVAVASPDASGQIVLFGIRGPVMGSRRGCAGMGLRGPRVAGGMRGERGIGRTQALQLEVKRKLRTEVVSRAGAHRTGPIWRQKRPQTDSYLEEGFTMPQRRNRKAGRRATVMQVRVNPDRADPVAAHPGFGGRFRTREAPICLQVKRAAVRLHRRTCRKGG